MRESLHSPLKNNHSKNRNVLEIYVEMIYEEIKRQARQIS